MPFTQHVLLTVSTVPLVLIVVVSAALLSVLGLALVRRLAPHALLTSHNALTGVMFQVLASAYAVLMAFVVVVSWQNFDHARSYVEQEANSLVDLDRAAAAFPRAFQDQAKALFREYVDVVVSEEWEALARGEESMNARAVLRKIWALYTNFEPTTEKEKTFFAASVRNIEVVREMRRLRIIESRAGVHPALWFILIFGGITIICFTFFFGADSFKAHAIMAATLAVTIALILLTILLFDFPFTGSVKVEPEMFRSIVNF